MHQVDANEARLERTMTAILTGLSFLADLPWLVAVTGLVVVSAGLRGERGSIVAVVYRRWLRPAVDPHPTEFVEAGPLRFSQRLGGGVLLVASAALAAGWEVAGWALVLAVLGLSLLSALTGFCPVCRLYRRQDAGHTS